MSYMLREAGSAQAKIFFKIFLHRDFIRVWLNDFRAYLHKKITQNLAQRL